MSSDQFYAALERFRGTKAAVAICLLVVIVGFVVAFMQIDVAS